MGGFWPSGVNVNKPVVFGIIVSIAAIYFIYRYATTTTVEADIITSERTMPALDKAAVRDLRSEAKLVNVTVRNKLLRVYVVQVMKNLGKAKLDVLFLHGQKFSSEDWIRNGSLNHVANWGYRSVAIDLPGHGKTTDTIDELVVDEFLKALVSSLKMKENVVIIAPSASGRYALPYLFNKPETSTDRAKGFVPITPVGTNKYVDKFPASQIPTLIVYGTDDKQGKEVAEDLKKLPKSETSPIEGAGHACYLNKPDEFHNALYNFLIKLSS
ncbi:putative protein-lysine deacylase ABHD14B isoform X2 [Physella acuta]|uniref:putative protein-lysine deacylase ABHD14B isoform X2 n=1 Tax=Physella acuta TaxID=109671 RepID=UPI0027DE8D9D|nr:putative protein-lysine deacylase ABHD14B isoform X2 [Physella acuta]